MILLFHSKTGLIDLSGNSVSTVWEEGEWVFKRQPKYLCDNESYALQLLKDAGIVPHYERLGDELIRMEKLERGSYISDADKLWDEVKRVLFILKRYGIRHGDITASHVFVNDGSIKIIDWAESRMWDDPRLDKRREGDEYWLNRTIAELLKE